MSSPTRSRVPVEASAREFRCEGRRQGRSGTRDPKRATARPVADVGKSVGTVRQDPTTDLQAARQPYRFTLLRRWGLGFGGSVTRSFIQKHVAKSTDRLQIVPTHQGARQGEKRFMNAGPPFVPQIESTDAMQPRQRALHDPAGAAEAAAVGAASFRQLAGDPAPFDFVAMPLRVIAAVAPVRDRVSQRPARTSPQRRNAIDERQQLRHVVSVRRREARDNRNPVRVGTNMMFRPGLTAIGRVRSSLFPPRSARSDALSTAAFDPKGERETARTTERSRRSRTCESPARRFFSKV
jgi:hypothetical protein